MKWYFYQITEIIEKLKSITLLEAAELVKQIEETFGVQTSSIPIQTTNQALTVPIEKKISDDKTESKESSTFDLILKEVPSEDQRSKRLTVFRIIRELTSLGLKESKELTNSLPKALKESISKQEAEEAKKQLESAGAKVIIQ
uniref:Large ribosomal subunit protein bL12c n=2 Tax=unclassified Ostreobium TaxID=2086555 RepID=A0A1X9RQA0_9CHLO|nr:ribosomal protein L12 [Ostreobium sp. HV05042]ARQ82326.1 ribosomal protein L12 [Ostreobium sp. HV05007a]